MIFTIYEFTFRKGGKIKTTKTIYVNPDHIVSISPNGDFGSVLSLSNGKIITVSNKFEDILNPFKQEKRRKLCLK